MDNTFCLADKKDLPILPHTLIERNRDREASTWDGEAPMFKASKTMLMV